MHVGDPLEVIPRLVGELRVDEVVWSEIIQDRHFWTQEILPMRRASGDTQ